LSTGGLPPLGRVGRLGIIGSMIFHNLSSISGLAIFIFSLTENLILIFPIYVLSDNPLIKF
jgi:hypothetical protein